MTTSFQDFLVMSDIFTDCFYVFNTVIAGILAAGVWSISKKMR